MVAYQPTAARLVVGTAQWGLHYGVTNSGGRLTDSAIAEVLAALPTVGVAMLDTAPTYGDAEVRIGALAQGVAVQTKASGVGSVRSSLARSAELMERMPTRLVLHDWPSLDHLQRVSAARELESLRAEGLVSAVGISGYTVGDLASALTVFDQLDVAQMPVSVLDQRLSVSREVAALRISGGLLQARSVYLQGLALSAPRQGSLADHPHVERLRGAAASAGVDVGAVCRGYVRAQPWIDEVVVGVTSAEELLAWTDDEHLSPAVWDALASDDAALLDPRGWPTVGQRG